MDAKATIRKADRMAADRSGFEGQAREIRTYIAPLAAAIGATETPGGKRRYEILDNTAEGVSELLASTIHGELANPAEFWFGLEADDRRLMRDAEVAGWLTDTERRLYGIFRNPKSGWSVMLDQYLAELVDLGMATAPIIDQPGRGIRFRHIPWNETYLEQDADGAVNTHFRRFKLTAAQAAREWPGAAGEKVLKAASSDNDNQEYDFLRAVTPMDKPDSAGRRFHSVWINIDETHTIGERAFFDFPYMAARWKTSGNEVYGRGPGHRALADVKMLQRAMKAEIGAAEMTIAPPLLVPDDGIVGPVTLASRGITTYRSDLIGARRAPVEPLLTGGRIDIAEEFNQAIRERIGRAYYDHLLRLPRDPRMLQDQFLEIAEERARVMGPVLDRVYQQAFGPTIDRLVMILLRGGFLLPVPAALQGQSVKATFKSPFAQARQVSEARAIARFWTVNGPVFDRAPDAIDTVDTDEALRISGEGLGLPRSVMRDPKIVEARRKARAEREQAQAGMDMVAQGASAAQSIAQAATAGGGQAAA